MSLSSHGRREYLGGEVREDALTHQKPAFRKKDLFVQKQVMLRTLRPIPLFNSTKQRFLSTMSSKRVVSNKYHPHVNQSFTFRFPFL
jgi:hypothetical protein